MECYNPRHIPTDYGERIVPCGKCNACLVRFRLEWDARLTEEWKKAQSSFFITLTYNPESEHIDENGVAHVYKRDVVLFNKRLRKKLDLDYHAKARYYLISEYGPTTFRPHYHGIYFLDKILDIRDFDCLVSGCWSQGFTAASILEHERIQYCTEYCISRNSIPDYLEPNFRLMSRNPGLGNDYISRMTKYHNRGDGIFFYTDEHGNAANLPRYWRDRILTEERCDKHAVEVSESRMQKICSKVDHYTSGFVYDHERARIEDKVAILDYIRKTDKMINKKIKSL